MKTATEKKARNKPWEVHLCDDRVGRFGSSETFFVAVLVRFSFKVFVESLLQLCLRIFHLDAFVRDDA